MRLVPAPAGRLGATLSAFAVGMACFAAPSAGAASQTFPGAMQEYLQATGQAPACPPACTLCHTSPAGGVETVRFVGFTENLRLQSALAFEMRGGPPTELKGADPSTVAPALQALETLPCEGTPGMPCDSDDDGVPDVKELRAGTDPDGPGTLGECPQYGCGASVAPRAATEHEVPYAWLVGALGVLVLVRRRK